MRSILATLLLLVGLTGSFAYAGGSAAERTEIAADLTTDTTSTAIKIPAGTKTFYGEVLCTSGACAQTQAIYGSRTATTGNGLLLCTLTLTDTTRDQDACAPATANFLYFYVITSGTSGTAATGAVYAIY